VVWRERAQPVSVEGAPAAPVAAAAPEVQCQDAEKPRHEPEPRGLETSDALVVSPE
jgi:hypothetical protein